jgi:uracil permease
MMPAIVNPMKKCWNGISSSRYTVSMQNKVDMNETRNVIIISVMLTMGLGGAVLSSGSFAISGIGLSAVIGVILNLVLPKTKKEEA